MVFILVLLVYTVFDSRGITLRGLASLDVAVKEIVFTVRLGTSLLRIFLVHREGFWAVLVTLCMSRAYSGLRLMVYRNRDDSPMPLGGSEEIHSVAQATRQHILGSVSEEICHVGRGREEAG